MINAILRLRRDNDYNYAKIKDSFIPANGEICLVDTARDGLRAVCGDGKTVFGQLTYFDEIIIKGYYLDNKFYQDKELTIELPAQTNRIYIDITKIYTLYIYDGITYHQISGGSAGSLPTATAQIPGIMKLYDTVGNNTDGTMTQKAITDELDDKVEVSLNLEEELLIFSN